MGSKEVGWAHVRAITDVEKGKKGEAGTPSTPHDSTVWSLVSLTGALLHWKDFDPFAIEFIKEYLISTKNHA